MDVPKSFPKSSVEREEDPEARLQAKQAVTAVEPENHLDHQAVGAAQTRNADDLDAAVLAATQATIQASTQAANDLSSRLQLSFRCEDLPNMDLH